MNPIHFQFVTTTPYRDRFSIDRLFVLLDDFDVICRDLVLRSAYNCFDLGNRDGYSTATYREDIYRDFAVAFRKAAKQGCAVENEDWREAYAVYGLISYVLVSAMPDRRSSEYASFRFHQEKDLAKYEEAMKGGDESSRKKAMEFTVYAMKTLEQMYHVRFGREMAYRLFCEKVVQPLLSGEDV